MKYENRRYWTEIHQTHTGQLKSVGWPCLSETFNIANYQSQSETVEQVLETIRSNYPKKLSLDVFDVGAGTGYFSILIKQWFEREGYSINLCAADISKEALNVIQARFPTIRIAQLDLSKINPNTFSQEFDLVFSFFCLHHLVKQDDFLNAITVAARSVREGGILLIMDPILCKPYSQFYSIGKNSDRSNGLPRKVTFLDKVLSEEGFERKSIQPVISFLLAGNIEAENRQQYVMEHFIWRCLQVLYRSDRLSKILCPAISFLDRTLKKTKHANSAAIVTYIKSGIVQGSENQV